MTFNWGYFPLESDGQSVGIQNPLPNFVTINGNPWSGNVGWFAGNGTTTSLVTPWSTSQSLFDGMALPNVGAYLIGMQVQLGSAPISDQTILFCGYSGDGGIDGLHVTYLSTGQVRFAIENRNFTSKSQETEDISNSVRNLFFYIDHRPVGTGVDMAYLHSYQDGTDIKNTSWGKSIRGFGQIYPQDITAGTALIVGAMQSNGIVIEGSHFFGKLRRLHIMNFGATANDTPCNLAELMGELSKATMIPKPVVLETMGVQDSVTSYSFVEYV